MEIVDGKEELTEKGRTKLGGEKRMGRDGTYYFLWDKSKVRKQ
ncbi:MAG: hypothetical protein ACTFAL_11370 [Candidatus Electronema sp. V4]